MQQNLPWGQSRNLNIALEEEEAPEKKLLSQFYVEMGLVVAALPCLSKFGGHVQPRPANMDASMDARMVIDLTDGDSDEVESDSDEVMSDGKRFCICRVSRV